MNPPALNFDDGDVSVILTISEKHQLHSSILRRFSSFFKQKLDENNAEKLTNKQRSQGMVIRWQALLTETPNEDKIGNFDVAGVNSKGEYPHKNLGICTLTLDSPIIKHYKNVLNACYGKDISLKEGSMSNLFHDAALLMTVAESLGCVEVVATKVENILLKQGQPLFRSISKMSIPWADLAYRTRSEVIFKEAIVHLVGQWKKYRNELNIRPAILRLCESKHADLEALKMDCEMQLLGYYPITLKRDRNQVADPHSTAIGPGSRGGGAASLHTRAHSYGLDILGWMALAIFRHWSSQSVCCDRSRNAADGGYDFYHKINEGGKDTYLDHATVNLFLEHFPMSGKARTSMEAHLDTMKDSVREYVEPLVVHNSQLDVTKFKIAYLTCCKVEKSDMPWLQEEPVEIREPSRPQLDPVASATAQVLTAQTAHTPTTKTGSATYPTQPSKKRKRGQKKARGSKKSKVKNSLDQPLQSSKVSDMLADACAEEASKHVKVESQEA